MLTITLQAARAIHELVADRDNARGLRIAPQQNGDEGALEIGLTLARRPHDTDEIVAGHGSEVFIEKRLAPLLSDKTLDVYPPEEGQPRGFRLIG